MEIIGKKKGAEDLGVGGLAIRVGERQAEGERGKLVVIGDEAPAMRKQRADFKALLFAALGRTRKASREARRVRGGRGSSCIPRPARRPATTGEQNKKHRRA